MLTQVNDEEGQTQYMGVVHRVEDDLNRGLMFATLDGMILCQSDGFTDMFGYSSHDTFQLPIAAIAPHHSTWDAEICAIREKVCLSRSGVLAMPYRLVH